MSDDYQKIFPKYPVYIISKGRYESMLTSRALSKFSIPHYIAIEPQEVELYEKALTEFSLFYHATLLVLPFSNHGDGPGRARNWCWDHSISLGAKRHWVLDDNIRSFFRFRQGKRIKFANGDFFGFAEAYIDQYENVPVSGFQYKHFSVEGQNKTELSLNTRIYSCLLIDNDCKHRWRGRYNEDTDLCLRVLKDGDCTIQFNSILQDKTGTQVIKGGNTEEFYHKENKDKIKKGYNPAGTINKSAMLVAMHPDVCKIVWRYGRWHHHCDYRRFKNNKLIKKDESNFEDIWENYIVRLYKYDKEYFRLKEQETSEV